MCEQVADEGRIFDDDESLMNQVRNFDEAKAFVTKENAVNIVEEKVKAWIKRLKDFMVESKQVKRENDNSGPQQELEYWKRRGAQFSQLVNKLQVSLALPCRIFIKRNNEQMTYTTLTCTNIQAHEIRMSLLCLQVARSKLIKDWVDAEDEVTYCYNEAKDNAKFIQALEKCCHCLYLDDPVR